MLHKADVANEEHMRSPRIKGNINIVPFLYCLSNEIGNFFLAVRVISHKYVVVERRKHGKRPHIYCFWRRAL